MPTAGAWWASMAGMQRGVRGCCWAGSAAPNKPFAERAAPGVEAQAVVARNAGIALISEALQANCTRSGSCLPPSPGCRRAGARLQARRGSPAGSVALANRATRESATPRSGRNEPSQAAVHRRRRANQAFTVTQRAGGEEGFVVEPLTERLQTAWDVAGSSRWAAKRGSRGRAIVAVHCGWRPAFDRPDSDQALAAGRPRRDFQGICRS